MNNEDFEGIFKFKFCIPLVYITSWALMIFGTLFFSYAYQIICMIIIAYSFLKNVGLITGAIYALCKLNSLISY